jgi:hypothetical protein
MRNRIITLALAFSCAMTLWAAPLTEEQRLERVQQKISERQVELQRLYDQHNREEGWADVKEKVEQASQLATTLEQAEETLHALEAEINLIKIDTTYGTQLALSGMLIVFIGLASLSLFIAFLPKGLAWWNRDNAPIVSVARAPQPRTVPADQLDEATLVAIAMVMHAETERASGQNLKVTLGLNPSPWALSSQMRVLPGRIHS